MQISTSPQTKKTQNVCYDSNEHYSKLNAIKSLLKRIAISVAHMLSVLLVSFE